MGLRPRYPCFVVYRRGALGEMEAAGRKSLRPRCLKEAGNEGTPLGLPAHGPSTLLRMHPSGLGVQLRPYEPCLFNGGAY
jgi:hypothetical protein